MLKPKTVGVELVGSTVKLEGSILSNFSAVSYAKLPFTVGLMDKPWMVVLGFKYRSSTDNAMGLLGGVGASNGFTPLFVGPYGWPENRNYCCSYLN